MNETPIPFRENAYLSLHNGGFHRIVYYDWGPIEGRIVLCVHYLTGNARYFDPLAQKLAAQGYRVIAPDMPGRGRSGNLPTPTDYNFPQYLHDLTALMAHLGITEEKSIDWIGASMGGFLGIIMAAQKKTPISRLVLVDVGPFLAAEELNKIALRHAEPLFFSTPEDMEKWLQKDWGTQWGPVPEGYWKTFMNYAARKLPDGRFGLAYDRALIESFSQNTKQPVDLWAFWNALTCPVLVLRGAFSTILTPDTAEGMEKNVRVTLKTIENAGHLPSLAMPEQIGLVLDWFKETQV